MRLGNCAGRFVGVLLACLVSVKGATQRTPAPKAKAAAMQATETASGYNQPPKNILDVMRAQSPPTPHVSPTGDAILLVSMQDYPSIARVATPFLRLAGARVEPKNHSKHDTPGGYGITPCATKYDLVHIADGAEMHVALPAGACPGAETVWCGD